MREGDASFRFALRQAKADRNGVVDLIHHGRIEPAHVLAQAALVNGADLLEQHDGSPWENAGSPCRSAR